MVKKKKGKIEEQDERKVTLSGESVSSCSQLDGRKVEDYNQKSTVTGNAEIRSSRVTKVTRRGGSASPHPSEHVFQLRVMG